jgi:hypothetical protein
VRKLHLLGVLLGTVLILLSCGRESLNNIDVTMDIHYVNMNMDYDDDGLDNDQEDINGNGIVDDGETDPYNRDTDGDGLWDWNELNIYGTDPINHDSDSDGITDGREVYSCGEQLFDTNKSSQHEAVNSNHNDTPDLIDALDPNNDSNENGESNMDEKLLGIYGCEVYN